MALSNPLKVVIEAVAGQDLEYGLIYHLVPDFTDGAGRKTGYTAVIFDSNPAQDDSLVGLYGVLDCTGNEPTSAGLIAGPKSGEAASFVVAGEARVMVHGHTVNITKGCHLYVDIQASANACASWFGFVRGKALITTLITAGAEVQRAIPVMIYNNPAALG